jgi:hypothetical protein
MREKSRKNVIQTYSGQTVEGKTLAKPNVNVRQTDAPSCFARVYGNYTIEQE